MTRVAFVTAADAVVTQSFDNYNPKNYGYANPYHKGIDYGVMAGNPVYACMDGTVTVAEVQKTGYGRHARILHADGSLSIYGHLTRLEVRKGDTVSAGQLIGKSGGDPNDGVDGDGLTTGAHLHWEIRPPGRHGSDQLAVDPAMWCLQYVPERIEWAIVNAFGGLNVRSLPDVSGRKLGAAKTRDKVAVVERSGKWARLRSLRPEWVHADYLVFTGEVEDVGVAGDDAPAVEKAMPTEAEMVRRLWEAHPELHDG